MKWIIFLFIIACGKHESPPSKDLFDNDGDTILNYQESGLDKYVAQDPSIGEIKGVISFYSKSNSNEPNEIKFTNKNISNKNIRLFLTKNKDLIKHEDFFSEFLHINLEDTFQLDNLNKAIYPVRLLISTPIPKTISLNILRDGKVTPIGNLSSKMEFNLANEDLTALLSGTAKLTLTPLSKNDIIKNTYRIYYSNNEETKVFYVSHQMKFEDFVKEMGISDYQNIDQINVFNEKNMREENQWWARNLNHGDKVLGFTNLNKLKESMLEGYELKKLVINRGDTNPTSSITISPSKSKVYFQFKATQVVKEFVEYTQRKVEKIGGKDGGPATTCITTFRSVAKEINKHISTDSFFDSIDLNLNIGRFHEENNSNNLYWETDGAILSDPLTISLKPKNHGTVMIGVISGNCGSTSPDNKKVNTETYYRIEIKVYIEKLE